MNDTKKIVGEAPNICEQHEGDNVLEKQEFKIGYSNGQNDVTEKEKEKDIKNGENEGMNGEDVSIVDKQNCNSQQPEEIAEVSTEDCVKSDTNAMTENSSRSATPQNKSFSSNGSEEASTNVTEMEPLVLEEDIESELQFDENSDKESGKSSPTLLRCVTRRSQTRNIPTPKTPKLQVVEQTENEKTDTPEPTVLTETSQDDLSTKAAVGNESTRLNFTIGDEFCSSFLSSNRQTPVGEALRRLSVRPSIRSISDSTQKCVDKDAYLLYQRRSVESVSGIKRKRTNYTNQEENAKKNRIESPGFFSYVTSPISNILGNFTGRESGPTASTPKLTSFKIRNSLENTSDNANISAAEECLPDQANKKWCILM